VGGTAAAGWINSTAAGIAMMAQMMAVAAGSQQQPAAAGATWTAELATGADSRKQGLQHAQVIQGPKLHC